MPVTSPTRRLLGVAAASALAVAGIALTQGGNAVASTPSSGTITDTSGPVTWTGGPFVAPNVTGNVGAPDCTAPQSCDDFTLHVTTPAGYGDQHRLTIATSWANTAADFDVYVYDAAGNSLGEAASSADPETVVLPPTTGTYDVRVVPFAPLAETYTATATMTTVPAQPAPGTATPPGFTNYTAPPKSGTSFYDSNNAGEPSIGDNWKTGSVMYQASLSTYKAKFDDSVSPAKVTWSDVSASATNGCPEGSTTSLDPILFTDHATGRTFESQLTGADSFTCFTDDDGATWVPSQGGGVPSGVDHQTIGGGPRSATDPLPNVPDTTGNTYPRAVYYCSQGIAAAFCAASHNGGETFGAGVPTYDASQCGGLHGHVKVAPDGTAYLPNKACGSEAAVAVSTDGGTTPWTVKPVTKTSAGDSDPSVGIGSNGTVYFGYVGADGRPGVAVSRDQGTTWTDQQKVGTDVGANGIQNAVFPTMVAGDDDRATLAYIGTPAAGNYQDSKFDGTWHLYLATTYDGGKTWVTSDATPNDPVQRGSICTSGTTCGSNRNLLDFIDVTTDSHGRIEVGYADGCIVACVTDTTHNSNTGPADAQAAYATIARQSSGLTLFSAFDPTPVTNVTLTNVKLARQRVHKSSNGKKWVDRVTVRNTTSKPMPSFTTSVTDNGRRVGSYATKLAPHSSKVFVYRWARTRSRHTIIASADPRNYIRERYETDNKRVAHRGHR